MLLIVLRRSLTFFAPRRHPCPVSKVALGRVVALEHISVPTLKQTHYTLNIHHSASCLVTSFEFEPTSNLPTIPWSMLGATTIPFLGASGSSVHLAGTQRGGWSQVPSLHTTLELSAGWKGASHVTVTTGHTMCSDHEARHVITICSPWSWPTLAPTSRLSTLPLLMSGTIQEAGKSSITDTQEIYDTDHSIGAQGGSRGRQPDKWSCSWDQRMSFPPRT